MMIDGMNMVGPKQTFIESWTQEYCNKRHPKTQSREERRNEDDGTDKGRIG